MKVWSWRQALLRAPLEPSTKLLLLALSTYMNDHGEGCYPSVEQLCKDTSLSERSVFYHLKKAESLGFLIKDKRDLSGKKWAANEYRAMMPDTDIHATAEHTSPPPRQIIPLLAGNLSGHTSVAVNNPEMQSLHPTKIAADGATGEDGRAAMNAPHATKRDAAIAVMGCNECSDGVQPLHTNSSENSPLNSPKEFSPKIKKTYPPEFEQFWMAWPEQRRCEKPNAYAAWREACRKISPDTLWKAAQRYSLSKDAIEGFASYPAKWLKRERWAEWMPVADVAAVTLGVHDLGGDTPENRDFLIILETLRNRHGEAVFRSWFCQLRLAKKEGGVLTLSAPTRFITEWVKRHFFKDIEQAVKAIWPDIHEMRIGIDISGAPHDHV